MREWKRQIDERLTAAGHQVADDVIEELAQHAAAVFQSARADGLTADEAAARVDALVAGWVAEGRRLRRRTHAAAVEPPPARSPLGAGLIHDVRYAVRLALRRPAPVLVAVLTMALGIGASTTLFSVTWGVLMTPLPWSDPDTLLRVHETRQGSTRTFNRILTNGTFLAWANDPSTIDGLAAYSTRVVTLTGRGDPQRVQVASATASLFDVLRIAPHSGTLFTTADERPSQVAVLAYEFWRSHFGAADDAIGTSLQFDGKSYVVAGVLPPGFAFPDTSTVAIVPFEVRPPVTADGGSWIQMFSAVARLTPGATPSQAAQEATARARQAPDPGVAAVAVFGTRGPATVTAEKLLDAQTAEVRDALWVLLAAVGLLLVIATANIAGVQLARGATRRREMAVRAAIGAGGGRLARQLLVENLLTGAAGGAAGLALAILLHNLLPVLLPADFPRVDAITLDARMLAFGIALALLSSLAFGLAPALQARRLDLRGGLADDAALSGTRFTRGRTARTRAIIMAGQVAGACVLLVGASLMVRTFVAMLSVDRGYDARNVLTARIATPEGLFTAERRAALLTRTLERLRGIPGVEHAGSTNVLPLMPGESMMALTLPPVAGEPERIINASFRIVSPQYFEAMGMRVLAGRSFSDTDGPASMPALIVNRAFAQRYLDGGGVGRRLPVEIFDGMREWEVAGIVENVIMRGSLAEPPVPEMFVTYRQVPGGLQSQPVVVVKTSGDPSMLAGTLRQIVAAEEPSAAVESLMTMEDRVMGSLARPRLYAAVLAGFAAFALSIAGVGLFGLLSYAVTQRAKELGVRAALGARPADLVFLVVREGLVITSAGVVVGLSVAVMATRWMATFLYGVAPGDLATLVVVPLMLLLVTIVAGAVPARRAATLDPLRVLRDG